MSDDTRHHLSFALRTMTGLINRKVLDAAADELDRLNTLIISMVSQSSVSYSEHKQQVAILQSRIEELERAAGTTRLSNG